MYLVGKGHQHTGPGTSMTQFNVPSFRGMGACGSCETRDSLGACCAGCAKKSNCSGSCKGGLMGMGLFESGGDFSQWGIAEWGLIGVGAYVVLSLAGDTRRAATSVRKYRRRRRAVAA